MINGDLAEFAAFYQLAAYYRRRLMESEAPLTHEERQFLCEMLADYESLTTKSREMMLRYRALGV